MNNPTTASRLTGFNYKKKRKKLMDQVKVNLLNITGLEAAYLAVQKPYGKKVKDPAKLFYKVSKILKHESVLEHIIFQFEVDGSSRLELQEHMRHRIASPTVASTRYSLAKMVEELDDAEPEAFVYKYTVFPEWMLQLKGSTYSLYLDTIRNRYAQLLHFAEIYKKYGADVAKYELIESLRTSFIWTVNLRSMLNFLKLRTDENAHFEIRDVIAKRMRELLCENEEIKRLLE